MEPDPGSRRTYNGATGTQMSQLNAPVFAS